MNTFYTSNVFENNGTYTAQFLVDNIPYYDFNNVTMNVTFDTITQQSTIEVEDNPIISSSAPLSIIGDSLIAGHVNLPILFETRLTTQNSTAELHINVKTDYGQNGLNPHWVNTLHTPLEQTIFLISPSNGQVIQTSDSETQVGFQFSLDQSLLSQNSTENISCMVQSIMNGTITVADGSIDANGNGNINLLLPSGSYNWRVLCKTPDQLVISQPNFFILDQISPVASISKSHRSNDEGSGRRRIITPLENLNLDNAENTENETGSNPISFITGAVIGTLGKRGTLGIGIFIVFIALALMIVYNREYLGLAKSKASV
jgi:hypothetical protein